MTDYEATVTVSNEYLPIDETSLVWLHNPVVDKDGYAVRQDADFKIVKVHPSLNVTKYLLGKLQK